MGPSHSFSSSPVRQSNALMPANPTFHEHFAGPQFFENKTPYHYFRLGHGRSSDRPFKLFVPITFDTYGDFINSVHLTLQFAARFEHSMTTFALVFNRPYKRDILKLYPLRMHLVVCKTNEALARLNLQFFEPSHWADGLEYQVYRDPAEIVSNVHWQDFVFLPNQQQHVFSPDKPMVPFRIPEASVAELHEGLVKLGLDESRWFCCMHYREPNYRWKPVSNMRDCDPDVYLPLIDYVIDRLGGQIIRIGHPEMRDYPPRPGFVDLAKIENSTLLQAYAASRTRFCISGPGGGACMFYPFDAPMGFVDSGGWMDGAYQHSFLLTHTVVTPDGKTLRQDALFQSGLMNQRALDIEMHKRPGFHIVKCTTEEICRVADFMYDRTSGSDGWRTPPSVPTGSYDNCFAWPMQGEIRPKFIDL